MLNPRSHIPNRHVVGHLTSNLLAVQVVLAISVFASGFDNVLFNTIQAMDGFVDQFADTTEDGKPALSSRNLAFLNSFPLLSYVAALLGATYIGERFGRLYVFYVVQAICLVGTAVTYTSNSFGQILAGRCIVYASTGIQEWMIPIMQAELVPAGIRGSMVTLFHFNFQLAALIGSIVCNFTAKNSDNTSWKIPVGIIFAFPALTLLLAWVVPESPRWLVRKGRFDEAVENLHFLYGCNQDYSAAEEAQLMKQSIDEAGQSLKTSWRDLVRGTNLRRTAIVMMMSMFNMLSGNAFTSHYGTVFFKQIGAFDPFAATAIKKGVVVLGPLTVMLLVERLGRRGIFLIFGTLSSFALLTIGGLGCGVPLSMPLKKGIVAMNIFFPYARIVAFGSIATVVTAEVPSLQLRDKTGFIGWSTQNLFDFVTSFSLPYLLNAPYANLGPRVAFIYGSFSLAAVVWAFFFLPELTGRSLEEIDELFEQRVPARKMKGWVSIDPDSVGVRMTKLEKDAVGTARNQGVVDKLGEPVEIDGRV